MQLSREVTAQLIIAVLIAIAIVFIWRRLLPYSYSYKNATNRRHSWHQIKRNGRRRWVRKWQIRGTDHVTGAVVLSRIRQRNRLRSAVANWPTSSGTAETAPATVEPEALEEPRRHLKAVNE